MSRYCLIQTSPPVCVIKTLKTFQIMKLPAKECVEIVRIQQFVILCDQIQKFMEGVRPLRYNFSFEIAYQYFLRKLELSQDAGVEGA